MTEKTHEWEKEARPQAGAKADVSETPVKDKKKEDAAKEAAFEKVGPDVVLVAKQDGDTEKAPAAASVEVGGVAYLYEGWNLEKQKWQYRKPE